MPVTVAPPLPLSCAAEPQSQAPEGVRLPSVQRLTAAMAAGDEDAFREFHEAYAPRLYAYLFVCTRGNEISARELLQQTLIKVARAIRLFDEEARFWHWLANIARHAAVDEHRKHRRYSALLEKFRSWRTASHAPDPGTSPMTASLELLPREDQELLRMKYVDGFSVREIASSLDATEKAIESRLSRLRQAIKNHLRQPNNL